jgi:hypothetical protein
MNDFLEAISTHPVTSLFLAVVLVIVLAIIGEALTDIFKRT